MSSLKFAGLTVRDVRASLGVNGVGRSELRLSLVRDAAAGDAAAFPPLLTPAYFTLAGFEFGGLLQSHDLVGRSADGMDLYAVVLVDPAEVLDAVALVAEGYAGNAPVNNVMNVYGYWENLTGFGSAGVNESGILWGKVVAAATTFANGPVESPYGSRIRFRGVTYGLDLTGMPSGVPADYRVQANGQSLLDVVAAVCRDFNHDFFVTLDGLTLTVNTVDRNAAATSGAAAAFLAGAAAAGVVVRSRLGVEGVTVDTATVLTGGYVGGVFESATVASYWGEDESGVPILGTPYTHEDLPDETNEYMTLPAAEVADVLGEDTYETNTLEIRAALAGFDSWAAYLERYKPDVAGLVGGLFRWAGDDPVLVKADLLKDARDEVLDAVDQDLRTRANQLYLYVRKWADEFYGRRYLVRIPDVRVKLPLAGETEPTFDYAVDSAGYVEGGAAALGVPAFARLKFTEADGRVRPFATVPAGADADIGGLDPSTAVVAADDVLLLVSVAPRIRLVGSQAGVVVTLPQPVFERESLLGGDLTELLKIVGLGVLRNAAFGNVPTYLHPRAVAPTAVAVALRSTVAVYGPWYAEGAQGKVSYRQDTGLVPWAYGSAAALDAAALLQVAGAVSSQTDQESLELTVVGTPAYSFGTAAGVGGPALTGVDIEYGTGGFLTTYRFRSFTPRSPAAGTYSRQQAELARRTAAAAADARVKALRADAKRAVAAEGARAAAAARAFRKELEPWQARESPHEAVLGKVVRVSDTDYRVGVSTCTQEEGLTLLNADSDPDYLDTAVMTLGGLLHPYRVAAAGTAPATGASNLPTAVWSTGESADSPVLTAATLNPLLPPHDVEGLAWGTGYGGYRARARTPSPTGSATVRALALKGPLMVAGWGRGIDGNAYPTGSPTANYAASHRTRSPAWRTGPLDPLWDPARGVWSVHDVYSGTVTGAVAPGATAPVTVTPSGVAGAVTIPARNLGTVAVPSGTATVLYHANRGEFVFLGEGGVADAWSTTETGLMTAAAQTGGGTKTATAGTDGSRGGWWWTGVEVAGDAAGGYTPYKATYAIASGSIVGEAELKLFPLATGTWPSPVSVPQVAAQLRCKHSGVGVSDADVTRVNFVKTASNRYFAVGDPTRVSSSAPEEYFGAFRAGVLRTGIDATTSNLTIPGTVVAGLVTATRTLPALPQGFVSFTYAIFPSPQVVAAVNQGAGATVTRLAKGEYTVAFAGSGANFGMAVTVGGSVPLPTVTPLIVNATTSFGTIYLSFFDLSGAPQDPLQCDVVAFW